MNKVRDLRSALELLENMPGQLIETDVEVDPMAEYQECIAMLEQAELFKDRQKKGQR